MFRGGRERNLWIGTEGQGLFIYNGKSVTRHITEKDGLLGNLINLLIRDKSGNIYIGTNKGLNKYEINSEKIYTYTRRMGYGNRNKRKCRLCRL